MNCYILYENEKEFNDQVIIKRLNTLIDGSIKTDYSFDKVSLNDSDIVVAQSLSSLGSDYVQINNNIEMFYKLTIHIIILSLEYDTDRYGYHILKNMIQEIVTIEKERKKIIKSNQRKGFQKAVDNGKKLGRPASVFPENFDEIYSMWVNKEVSIIELLALAGLKRGTFYKLIKKYEVNNQIFK